MFTRTGMLIGFVLLAAAGGAAQENGACCFSNHTCAITPPSSCQCW